MSLSAIKHVVVLMMENRSFDTMLGYLAPSLGADGLTGNEWNPTDTSLVNPTDAQKVWVWRSNTDGNYRTNPDAGHGVNDSIYQLYGSFVQTAAPPTNMGFMADYLRIQPNLQEAKNIMACFDPSYLPVLSTLAQNFLVCDRWFSSLPGPTWPNRFYVHAATSAGHAETPSDLGQAKEYILGDTYKMRTIFDNIADAGRSWRIYYHDVCQASLIESVGAAHDNLNEYPVDFYDDLDHGNLADYTFIEPSWVGAGENDMR